MLSQRLWVLDDGQLLYMVYHLLFHEEFNLDHTKEFVWMKIIDSR